MNLSVVSSPEMRHKQSNTVDPLAETEVNRPNLAPHLLVLKVVSKKTIFNTTPRDFKYFHPGFNKINNDDSLPSITWES